ncbi:hypothetical protein BJY52DRAFT_111145 [Lactarius psammicola]|nr:hypothetical protein BJY52DRAFT_111145 [Lactarius psammicola]
MGIHSTASVRCYTRPTVSREMGQRSVPYNEFFFGFRVWVCREGICFPTCALSLFEISWPLNVNSAIQPHPRQQQKNLPQNASATLLHLPLHCAGLERLYRTTFLQILLSESYVGTYPHDRTSPRSSLGFFASLSPSLRLPDSKKSPALFCAEILREMCVTYTFTLAAARLLLRALHISSRVAQFFFCELRTLYRHNRIVCAADCTTLSNLVSVGEERYLWETVVFPRRDRPLRVY